jgi:hypothetical protein
MNDEAMGTRRLAGQTDLATGMVVWRACHARRPGAGGLDRRATGSASR